MVTGLAPKWGRAPLTGGPPTWGREPPTPRVKKVEATLRKRFPRNQRRASRSKVPREQKRAPHDSYVSKESATGKVKESNAREQRGNVNGTPARGLGP